MDHETSLAYGVESERAREPSSKSKQWIFNSSSSPLSSSSSSRICHTLIGADVYRAQHKGIINFHFQLRFMDETSLSLSRLSCRDSVSTPATEKKWKKKHNCNSKQQHITLESLRNGTQKIVRLPYEKNIYIYCKFASSYALPRSPSDALWRLQRSCSGCKTLVFSFAQHVYVQHLRTKPISSTHPLVCALDDLPRKFNYTLKSSRERGHTNTSSARSYGNNIIKNRLQFFDNSRPCWASRKNE